jgi:hypothetical protein
MLRAVHVAIVTLLVAGSALGATITVRKDGTGDFAVIQQALNVAAAGDTILIGPGEYLDKTWIRFPAWSHDIESFANVTVDNLTIIGAGADQTLIGPTTYSGNTITESPMVMTYIEGADLRLEGVCLRNSDCGLYMSGRLFVDRCVFYDNGHNLWWESIGSGGWIRDSQFDVVTPLGANFHDARRRRGWRGISQLQYCEYTDGDANIWAFSRQRRQLPVRRYQRCWH